MSDLMQDAASFLVNELATNLSETVTLRRAGKSTTGVKATKCPVRAESEPTVNEDIANFDWIIAASAYLIGGVEVTPQKNDVIEESSGERHQVLPLSSEPEARPLDPFGTGWRIHSKRIQEAD